MLWHVEGEGWCRPRELIERLVCSNDIEEHLGEKSPRLIAAIPHRVVQATALAWRREGLL